METAGDLLFSMHQRGVRIWVEHGQLRFRSRKGAVSSEELCLLRALKVQIIELLEGEQSIAEPPLHQRKKSSDSAPLTALQETEWNYAAEACGPHVRFCAFGLRIIGALNIELLEWCFQTLVCRHELLRSRIVVIDDSPRQVIDTAGTFNLEMVDLAAANSLRGMAQIDTVVDEFLQRKINFSDGPLFAALLVKEFEQRHVLAVSLDHMITDGVSNEILTRELWALYAQGAKDRLSSLPEQAVQFADYAHWLRTIYPCWRKKHAPYWETRFADAPCPKLPIDQGSVDSRCASGAQLTFQFGAGLTNKLCDFAKRECVPPALVILTVYVVLMARWCNQTDLVVLLVESGRHRPELQNMIGWLTSHLHLRIHLPTGTTFLSLLAQVTTEFQAAVRHQDFNWVPSLMPGLKTDLYFNWRPNQEIAVPRKITNAADAEVSIEPFPVKWPLIPPFPFGIFFTHSGAQLTATLVFRPDLFVAGTMRTFADNLLSFSRTLIQRPLAHIDSLQMATV